MNYFLFAFFIASVVSQVDPNSVTVSGLSSGAYFATQYQFAHSSTVQGAAIFAGGPYYCAAGVLTNALIRCMNGLGAIPLPTLESYARNQASTGLIDPLTNLANHAVYIFAGTMDNTVKPSIGRSLEQMYRNLGVTDIETKYDLAAAHTFPTPDFGNLCLVSSTPYISRCSYDGAGAALHKLYGTLLPPGTPVAANFVQFSQGDFTPNGATPASLSLNAAGYAYIPTGCQPEFKSNSTNAVCRLHVSFHGCQQYIGNIGLDWVENTGYNEWAESNNIIIVYPQAIASSFLPSNPNGCWDWWGYLEPNYANKRGPQIATVHNIINHFLTKY